MHRLLLLSLLFLVIACKKESDDTNAEQSYMDVAYGTHSLQKMDIYLPANSDTTATKLMILIHGGAWIEGDKADFTASIKDIKKLLPETLSPISTIVYTAMGKTNSPPRKMT
jgi:acetyl esterase/lipase